MPSVAHFGGACSKKRAEAAGKAARPVPSPLRAGKRVGTDPGKGSGQTRGKGSRRTRKWVGTRAKTGPETGSGQARGRGRNRPGESAEADGSGSRGWRRSGKEEAGEETAKRNRKNPCTGRAQKNVRQEGVGKQSARRRDANAHAARAQKNRAAGCTLQPTARSLFHGYTAAPTHRRGGRCPQDYIQRVSIIVGLFEPPTAS